MTSIPSNLTLIRNSFRESRALRDIKAEMLAATTDYVMVVGPQDLVDVLEPLTGDIHYLATHVGTGQQLRYSRPALPYDPVLLTQFNYLGSPILHKSLVPLFPEAAVEPWHTVMLRAQSQGASFGLVSGGHVVIEPWPRPKFSGAFGHFRTSFDPTAVMQAIPAVQVQEINQRPFYSLKEPRLGSVKAFCRNCSSEFLDSISGFQVSAELVQSFDPTRISSSNAEYVGWFDGIAEAANDKVIEQLQVALEFPGVVAACPRIVSEFSPSTFHMPAFWLRGGIYTEFSADAWLMRTRQFGSAAPVSGCTNSHAILRKLP